MVVVQLTKQLTTCFTGIIGNKLGPASIGIVSMDTVAKNNVITITAKQRIGPYANRAEKRTKPTSEVIKTIDRQITINRIVDCI